MKAVTIVLCTFLALWIGLIITAFVGVKAFGWGEVAIPLAIFVPPFVLCLCVGGGGDGY